MRFKDLKGQRFGALVVLYPLDIISKSKRWICQCDCGNYKETSTYLLTSGKTKSCGCKKLEYISEKNSTHGMTKTRFFHIWTSMKRRAVHKIGECYKNVSICDRWLIFDNFKTDMYLSYQEHVKTFGEKQTTIDRINVRGNYELSNCRWATMQEQAENKTNTRVIKGISITGEEKIFNNIRKFSRENNLHPICIVNCLKLRHKQHKGWKFEYIGEQDNE